MKFTRRQFLKGSLVTGAYVAAGGVGALWKPGKAHAFAQSPQLTKFIQPLRGIGGAGIPVAAADAVHQAWWQPGVTHYTLNIGQFEDQLHPNLPNPTRLWGYGQGPTADWRHLGGIIATHRDNPVQITFQNGLPATHIIPVDTSSFFPDAVPNNRAATHLHGGVVAWISDGGPYDWFDPLGNVGPSFFNNVVLNPTAVAGQAEYYYGNGSSARLHWYHDHAHDLTRINAYAGIASGYVIFDDYETIDLAARGLPGPLDPRTLYLIFQDKIFVRPDIASVDPTWPIIMPDSRPGDLWYAHVYDPARWTLGPAPNGPPPDPSVIAEFFGDTILVNGTVYPYVELEQRQYRFRLLNACNARFLNPKLFYAKSNSDTSVLSKEENPSAAGPAFIQIGTEGGFLPHAAMLNGPGQSRFLMAPAERADLIVDLRNVPVGSRLILANNAPAPFPAGDALNDYSPTNFQTPSSKLGFGPNTRTLLQIRVKARSGSANPPITLPATFMPTDPFMIDQTPGVPIDAGTPDANGFVSITVNTYPGGIKTPAVVQAKYRYLTLNEGFDGWGRLTQTIGTNAPSNNTFGGGFGLAYTDAATEIVDKGAYEIWEVINLTGDTHPIHFHLVNVQILNRQFFSNAATFAGTPAYSGALIAPDNNELGWKETVRMNPGQVIRVTMKFDLPSVPFNVPSSTRTPVAGKKAHEYVYHCHILEHEEHDMMRPLVVAE